MLTSWLPESKERDKEVKGTMFLREHTPSLKFLPLGPIS
jgi:hypothetical protein